VKRSRQISLVLLGGISSALMTSCAPRDETGEPRVTVNSYYANNHFIRGAGYYHAPFRAFFPQPYNSYDRARKQFYYGGTWGATPYDSAINVSAPTLAAAEAAQMGRTQILREGFGSTGTRSGIWS
jgi:hypothetical protein